PLSLLIFCRNIAPATEIFTLSLHDALPIYFKIDRAVAIFYDTVHLCRSVTYRKSSCYILLHLLGPFPPNVIVTHPLTRLYDTHGLRIYQRKPPFLVGSHI